MVVGEKNVKSILTKTNLPVSDFAVNPYIGCSHACRYCYASFMKRFTDHREPWGEFVDIKNWPAINKPGAFEEKEAFLSSVTDPYQPLEKKYKRTRAVLEQLQDTGISISISTKSDLVLRDLDLIRTFPRAHVSWSVNTLDESFRGEMDRAVSIERRLEAMRIFYEAGIETTCFISPIFPGITDVKAIIERVTGQCNMVWLENLNLRGDYKKKILDWIREHRPDLDGLYREIYTRKDRAFWTALDREIRDYAEAKGMLYTRDDSLHRAPFGEPPVISCYFYHEELTKTARKGKS